MRRIILLAACLAAGAAHAQTPDAPAPWAKPYAGRWTLFSGGEGDPVCGLNLGAAPGIGGAQIELSATCRRNWPLEDVAAWRLDGRSIVLIDALRKPLLRFAPLPDKSWSATIKGDQTVFLERGAPERPKSLKYLIDDTGTFTLSGPNNAGACGFAMTAKSAMAGTIEQGGRCPASWKAKGWKSWTAVGDRLEFKTAKGAVILTLTRADEYSFVADTPSGPLFFGPGAIDGSEALER